MSSYYESVKGPFADMFAQMAPRDNKIYQYCSLSAFENIVKNKEFWLTESAKMNDHAEGRWLNILLNRWFSLNSNQVEIDKLKDCLTTYEINQKESYLCCFSTASDILSQWRAYADDGHGVTVGIDISKLKIRHIFPSWNIDLKFTVGLLPVIYTEELQMKFIDELIKSVLINPTQATSIDVAFTLNGLSLIFKNPAFQEEREYRLICTPFFELPGGNYKVDEFGITECDFRTTRNGLSPFFRMKFDNIENLITDVVLGPKNYSSEAHIELFLKKYGHAGVKITRSQATYR